MRLALCTVCLGAGPLRQLDLVWSTWERFSKRHGYTLRVLEEMPPAALPEHTPLLPELRGFDGVLLLAPSIAIAPDAPSPAEGWDGAGVGAVGSDPDVLLLTRAHAAWAQSLPPTETPFLSAVRQQQRWHALPAGFNRPWWDWWEGAQMGSRTSAQLLGRTAGWLGRAMPAALAHRGADWWRRAWRENAFVNARAAPVVLSLLPGAADF